MSRQFKRQMQKQQKASAMPSLPNMSGLSGNQMDSIMKMQEMIQEDLGSQTVLGSAAGDMVKIEMNGRQELISVKIDPKVVDPEDVEMLEDLIVVAFKDALSKSQELGMASMSKLTGGLKLPGLF